MTSIKATKKYPKNTHIPVSISRDHGKVNNGV